MGYGGSIGLFRRSVGGSIVILAAPGGRAFGLFGLPVGEQQQKQPSQSDEKKEPQKTPKERENERFQKETGMSKDRAMQLLKALEQNEKTEQKKKLEAERAKRRKGKDW